MNTELNNLIEELYPIAEKFTRTQTVRMNAKEVNKLAVIDLEVFSHTLNRTCNSCIKTCLNKLYNYYNQKKKLKAEIQKVSKPVKVKVFEAPKETSEINYASMKHQELYRLAVEKGYTAKSRKKADVIAYLNSL